MQHKHHLPIDTTDRDVIAIVADADNPLKAALDQIDPSGVTYQLLSMNPFIRPLLGSKKIGARSNGNGHAPKIHLEGDFDLAELQELVERMTPAPLMSSMMPTPSRPAKQASKR